MKIWIQSCAPLKHKTRSDYQNALRNHASKIKRADTHVEFHGVDSQIPGMITSHTGANYCGSLSTRNAIIAERGGFDAFLMSSVPDCGYYRIREMVNFPVVFICESAIHIALLHGHKYAFLTVNPFFLQKLMQNAKKYGLSENMVDGTCVDISYAKDFPIMFSKPKGYIDKIQKAVSLLADRGANIVIPGPVPISMLLVQEEIRAISSARILDVFGCGLKMTELMVDLHNIGMVRSKNGLFSGPPDDIMQPLSDIYTKI